MVAIQDDNPKNRDYISAKIENFLYKIRNNENMKTFVHRRDEDGKTVILIGLDDHEQKNAIVNALSQRAEKEGMSQGIKIFTKELKSMKASLNKRILNGLVEMGAIPSPNVRLAAPIRWQAVFFIGPAGSGKSFVKTKKYLRHLDFKEVDPDEIKKLHPDYDPENPFAVHAWSRALAQAQLNEIMTDGSGSPVIVDGTGRDYSKIEKQMRMAEKNGYKTHLVYVYVPFEVSIWRNRNRPRFVPEDVIMEQSQKIAQNYKKLRTMADKSKVILNYEKPEQKLALEDIELYPVPQPKRPPRPGDPEYGALDKVASALLRLAKEISGI
jgi:predicted ABC-type ATPase